MSDDVKFQHDASFLLATVGRRAEHEWNRYLRQRGITTSQFTAMAVLLKSETSQRGLAISMGIDPRNAGGVVRELESRGWIRARSDATDGRVRLLAATQQGRNWWDSVQLDLARERDHFFGPLSAAEIDILRALLNRLDEHLAER